jgi:hypothetical protein
MYQNQVQAALELRKTLPRLGIPNQAPHRPDNLRCSDEGGGPCNHLFDGRYDMFHLKFSRAYNHAVLVSAAEARCLGATASGIRSLALLERDYSRDPELFLNFCHGVSSLTEVYIVWGDSNFLDDLHQSIHSQVTGGVRITPGFPYPSDATPYQKSRYLRLQNVLQEQWQKAGLGGGLLVYNVTPL